MKVLQVVLNLKFGGLEKLVIQLSEELKKRGVDVSIVCLQERGELAAEAERKGIKVLCLRKKEGFEFDLIFRLRKLIKEEKADIIHTHNSGPLIYGTLAALLAGARSINTRHSRTEEKVNGLIWNLNRFVVAVSEDTKKEINKYNRISPDKMKVVYNGINLGVFNGGVSPELKQKKREQCGLHADSFVIGNIGRLVLDKDQETLLKAFRKLVQKKFNGELVIVGDGPLNAQLKKTAKEFNISDRVKFLGFREDISELINMFDVYVLSSIREGISLTLLEAMASRKPIVATKVGGNPEVVIDNETGLVVPPGFPERIEGAIMRLSINKGIAQQMGEAGEKRVKEKFSVESMASGYEALYREALK